MPLTKYNFKPGIDREGTDYSNEGGWFDINLVRFRKGFPEKIGGWVKEQITTYLGIGRALHAWIALEGTKYLGVGTTYKYYIKEGDTFNDVTPIRTTTSAGDVTFSATNGDATLTVTDADFTGGIDVYHHIMRLDPADHCFVPLAGNPRLYCDADGGSADLEYLTLEA